MIAHSEVEVAAIPPCDLCGAPAIVDGKTRRGPWANMCDPCFGANGVGLGLGRGQLLHLPGQAP